MDKKSTTNSSVPDQATVPEEDATLLAIEALEARSIDPNPRPWNAPRETPVPERPVVAPAPRVIEPVISKPVVQPPQTASKPVESIKPIETKPVTPVTHTSPPTPAVDTKSVVKPVAPVPVVPPKPKKHLTTSEKIAEELANAPAPSRFQFFSYRNPPRKPFVIIGIIVVIIGIGVAAYVTLH